MPSTTTAAVAPSRALGYTPALDGIRAVAVLAVLAFHGDVPGASGGFLGVSTFFTLSGFLITSLLLVHVHQPQTPVRGFLGTFWSRRFRRLAPAALVGIVLATAVTLAVGSADARRDLRGDVLSALGEVANWHFLASDRSYGSLFTEPSALLHHWSLAIEEQFYLVVPLLVVAALRWRSPGRRLATLTVGATLLLAASIWSSLRHLGDADRLYYGSDTRAAELLAGCLLAIGVYALGGPTGIGRTRRGRRVLVVAGGLALVASAAAWVLVERGDDWLHPGGLLGYAALSALLVVGALVPGPPARLLSLGALVWIGRRSYGIYVLHWPLFLLLDESRTGLDGVVLLAARVTVTVVVAAVVFVVVEQPIRHREPVRWLPRRRWSLGVAVIAVVLVAVLVVPVHPGPTNIDFATIETQFQHELEQAAPVGPAGASDPGGPAARSATVAEPPPPWLVVVGDRTAGATSYAVLAAIDARPEATYGGAAVDASCSLLRGTAHRDASGVHENPPTCEGRAESWSRAADAADADVVVVQVGAADVGEHGLEGRWTALGDPELDARLADELDAVITDLRDDGRVVALATMPTDASVLGRHRPWGLDDATYRLRALRFNELVAQAVAAHPEDAVLLDIDRWHVEHGGGATFRPDGDTPDPTQSMALASFVLDQLLVAHRASWTRWQASLPARADETSDALRVLVVGDSTALPFAIALHGREGAHHDVAVASVATSNCGLIRGGTRREGRSEVDIAQSCADWEPTVTEALDQFRPDVVLVVDSLWELGARRLPGEDRWVALGDPAFDAHARAELQHLVDVVDRGGARVAFVRYPVLDLSAFEAADRDREQIDTDVQLPRLHALVDGVVADRPEVAAVLDLAGHTRSQPGGELDPSTRPDGVHYTEQAARDLVDAWLLDQLRAVATTRPT